MQSPEYRPVTRVERALNALTDLRERSFLLWSFALGLVVHGTFTMLALRYRWMTLRIDEVNVAWRLFRGHGFSFNYYRLFDEPLEVGAFFPPGYVYNVWGLFEVFGTRYTVPVQNLLLTLAVSYCVYVFGKRIFGDRTARIAMLASLVYPPFFTRIGHGSPVYFKMLFMVLTVMALHSVWTRCRQASAPVFWPALRAGVLGGLLALSMPDALAFLLLFVAALALVHRFRPASLRVGLIVLASAGLVIAPWTARNWVSFGTFCLVSSNGGFNFYMGNCPNSAGEVDYSLITDLDERLDGELMRTDEFGRDKILYREALAYIGEHRVESALAFGARALQHWFFRPDNLKALADFGGDEAEYDTKFRIYIWTYAATYVPLFVLSVLGLVALRGRLLELAPLWLPFVYSTIIACMFVVQTKMRLIKVEPFLILFAAYYIAQRFPRRATPTLDSSAVDGIR